MSSTVGRSRVWLVAAEWVIGDDGRNIQVGDTLHREARPADEDEDGDLRPVLARIMNDVTARPTVYVWHPDDPAPPAPIRGTVIRIWSVPSSHHGGVNPLDGLQPVSAAIIDWGVELYVFEIEGEVSS